MESLLQAFHDHRTTNTALPNIFRDLRGRPFHTGDYSTAKSSECQISAAILGTDCLLESDRCDGSINV